jgi:hypothetical protein
VKISRLYLFLAASGLFSFIAAQEISRNLDLYMQALTKLDRFSGSVVVAKGYGDPNYLDKK